MKLTLATIRYGIADWLDVCAPTLDAYAARHGLTLRVWDDTDRGYPCVKFCEYDMLKEFLAGDADFMMYIDADVLAHPEAPLPELVPGLSMATCVHHREHNDHWTAWCKKHFKVTPTGFEYSNAGVWLIDRMAAEQMLVHFKPPFIEEFQDQHAWNLAAYLATKDGMKFNRLPDEWNRYGEDHEPSWLHHLWGSDKMRAYHDIMRSGFPKPSPLRFNIRPLHWPYEDKVVVTQFVKDCGLGNTLFEVAGGLAVARRLGIPYRWNWTDTGYREFGLEAFGLGKPVDNPPPIVCQKYGQGNRAIFERVVAAVHESKERLCGVCTPFQSEDCFIDIADEIRELFKIEPLHPDIPEGRTPVAVQVRRGDYLKHRRLNVTTEGYFRNAMVFIRGKVESPHFVFISDDPKWCEDTFGHFTDVTVIPPQSAIDGLRTMVACQAHIISNSTYGWWGAWLSGSDTVVVPEIWYHGKGAYGDWEPAPERWHRVSIGAQKPMVQPVKIHPNLITAEPTIERAIVYPYLATKAKWQELRYSLRSIDRFFEDRECPIYIYGTHMPEWLRKNKRVVFKSSWTYSDALIRGVQTAKEILWMNDDTVLLKPTTWDDCRVPRYLRPVKEDWTNQMHAQMNPWQQGVIQMLTDLQLNGYEDLLIYSTHLPYVYRRNEAIETLRKYGVWEKIPFELAYFHEHAVDPQLVGDLLAVDENLRDAQFLNHTDRTLTRRLKDMLVAMFPDRAEWENSNDFPI